MTLVGFDPPDLLYMGAHSLHFSRKELDQYSSQYRKYDFETPDHLVETLQDHAKKYGPIRYLKIATHGHPGQLYTRSGSWIDSEWLKMNRETLKTIFRGVFAPNAEIILFSCLVGANLDHPQDGVSEKAGEEFLDLFADVFLVNGGRVDSSTRVLLGLDIGPGSLVTGGINNGILMNHQTQDNHSLSSNLPSSLMPTPRSEKPSLLTLSTKYSPSGGDFFQETTNRSPYGVDVSSGDESTPEEILIYTGKRLTKILVHLPEYWWKYGVNLEGPWWQKRYRHVEVGTH